MSRGVGWVRVVGWSGILFLLLPAGVGSAAEDTVVARVNNRTITRQDFEQELERLSPQQQAAARRRPAEFLQAIVREEVLYQQAVREGLDRDTRVLARLHAVKRNIVIQALVSRKIIEPTQVTAEEVKAYYDGHLTDFSSETVTASHILVDTEAEAHAILKELQAGTPFEDLAKAKSLDRKSAVQGGKLGRLARGQTVPEFEQVAFALKIGQLSQPVKSNYGFHIIKVSDHQVTRQAFDEVKTQIENQLLRERRQSAFTQYMDALEKAGSIEVFE
ncbi:MAG: peptidylprolyl isomerase, partial [Candidatus Methylomirabilales bacterium]